MASSRIFLAGTPQIALLIQLRQFAQTILQFLPSRHSLPHGFLRPSRNVVARGLAPLPAVTDIQMRTMLGPFSLAMAARSSAGAVGFRERSKDGDLGQTFDLAQQLASLSSSITRPGHGSSDALGSEQWKTDSW